jgi:superfamily II DNA or RNA helicase
MLKLVVNNRVLVPVASQDDALARELQSRFTHANPSYQTWKRFKMGAPPPKEIVTWRSEGRGRFVSVPRGAFIEVCDLLIVRGYADLSNSTRALAVEDRTTFPTARKHELKTTLWPHQREQVATIVHPHVSPAQDGLQPVLWRSPPASGKTQSVLACAAQLGTKTLVITPTGNLFDQWCVRVTRELGLKPGRIRAHVRDLQQITIATHQTLAKCAHELSREFGFVVLDECQGAGADTVQHVCDAFHARYRLGVSADERRADRKEFLIHDIFGPVAHEVKREQLEGTGEIVDVEVRVVPTEFRADWWTSMVAKDPSSERQRAQATRDRVQERHRLLGELTEDPDRNALVIWCCEQELARREQVVVLTDRREHCHALHSGFASRSIRSGLFIGGPDYRDQFTTTLAGLNRGDVRAAVGTYQAVGVGFEAHRRLAVGVCASPCVNGDQSRMQFNQYRGRFARSAPGKKNGVMYYLWDRHVFGLKPVQLLKRWNANVSVLDGGRWVEAGHYLRDVNK